ncbi:MAG: mscS 1 [Sporomusa sp.]|jgi:small-conductance mechanosensitive channel|nr:mscS 1 [Sporomusa sp.]
MIEQLPELQSMLVASAIYLVCVAAGVVLSRIVFLRFDRISAAFFGPYYEVTGKAIKGMPIVWGIIIGSYAASRIVNIDTYWLRVVDTVTAVVGALSATIIAARILSGIVRVFDEKAQGIFPSASIFASLVEISTYVIGVLILLQNMGFSIAPILTALGVGGLAVALALQETLSNLFSGVHILLARHIKVGDYIKLSTGEEGNVVDISWRNTTIKSLPDTMIIVPNKKIASAIVTNFYMPNKELSIVVSVGVSYDSDLEHVERITIGVAKEVMASVDGGVTEFEPIVRFHSFGESSIDFNVILRIKEYVNQYKVKHEFIKRLHIRYRQEKIQIPFPIRTVYLKQIE